MTAAINKVAERSLLSTKIPLRATVRQRNSHTILQSPVVSKFINFWDTSNENVPKRPTRLANPFHIPIDGKGISQETRYAVINPPNVKT
jgi:hypothetical protein